MIIANMQTTTWKPWTPRVAAFLVGLLLAGSLVYWALRWPVRTRGADLPVAQSPDDVPPPDPAFVARILGADAAAAAAAAPDAGSRFLLTGIVGLGAGRGVALLSIDGKPARPFRVGSQIEEGWVLQSVQQRSVALGADAKGPARLQLELPPRQP